MRASSMHSRGTIASAQYNDLTMMAILNGSTLLQMDTIRKTT
jgi:hypothetical protein